MCHLSRAGARRARRLLVLPAGERPPRTPAADAAGGGPDPGVPKRRRAPRRAAGLQRRSRGGRAPALRGQGATARGRLPHDACRLRGPCRRAAVGRGDDRAVVGSNEPGRTVPDRLATSDVASPRRGGGGGDLDTESPRDWGGGSSPSRTARCVSSRTGRGGPAGPRVRRQLGHRCPGPKRRGIGRALRGDGRRRRRGRPPRRHARIGVRGAVVVLGGGSLVRPRWGGTLLSFWLPRGVLASGRAVHRRRATRPESGMDQGLCGRSLRARYLFVPSRCSVLRDWRPERACTTTRRVTWRRWNRLWKRPRSTCSSTR